MANPRTCPQCGRQMTTAQVWRNLMGKMGWRVTCPGCGKVHVIPVRERGISALYFVVLPLIICTVGVGTLDAPADHLTRGFLAIGLWLVCSTLGTWGAARRLRLG